MARRKVNTQGNNPDTAKKTKKTEKNAVEALSLIHI